MSKANLMRFALAALLSVASTGAIASTVFSGGLEYPAANSNLPFINPGSGSVGNNGALTLGTALSRTYTAAYVYVQAGMIATSTPAAAGWYYTVCSSTTACTIYNNAYSGTGTPTIPASPTAFATTGPGAYTGYTTEVPSYEYAIPANMMGPRDRFRIHEAFSATNDSNQKFYNVHFGAAGVGAAYISNTNVTTAVSGGALLYVMANESTQSQTALFDKYSTYGLNTNSNGMVQTALDMTQIETLTFGLKLNTATDNMVLEGVSIEMIKGVP